MVIENGPLTFIESQKIALELYTNWYATERESFGRLTNDFIRMFLPHYIVASTPIPTITTSLPWI